MDILFYGSLLLLAVSIIYLGRQIQVLISKRRDLGDVVFEIYPTKKRRILVTVAAIAFVVLLIVVSILYMINDTPFSYMNILVIVLACFAGASFLGRTTVMYDKGMIAYTKVIEYGAIKSYEFKEMKKRNRMLLYLQLSNKVGFQVVINSKDRAALDKILKKIV